MPAVVEMVPIVQGNSAVLYGRLTDNSGTALVQGDISSITAKVFDMNDKANAVAEETLTIADVIYNTVQAWPTNIPGFTAPDTVGYNFKWETPAGWFPAGNRNYQTEVIATVGGKPRGQIWRQPTVDLFQS